MTGVTIQGRRLTFPVEVRRASAWSANFLVRRGPAAALLPDGFEPAGGTHTIVSLAFVRYEESDLDAYHELGVAIGVRPYGAPPASALRRTVEALTSPAVYIRHLPVDQAFTMEAGRAVWGYPKRLAEIEIVEAGGSTWCRLSEDGRESLRLGITIAGRIGLKPRNVPTYSDAEGVLNKTSWRLRGEMRARPGGATLRLGDGVIADELASLGLPKTALFTTSMRDFSARFGEPARVATG